jgi:CBS domain-containing protein
MSPNVRTISERESLEKAARLMKQEAIGFLPVTGPEGRLVGVLTDRDLVVRAMATGLTNAQPVVRVMTPHPYQVGPDDQASDAVALMREKNIGRLLVSDEEGRLLGVFSLGDAAAKLGDHVTGNSVIDAVARHSHVPAEPAPMQI